MIKAFGQDYAAAYDLLYADKDYGAECDILEGLIAGEGPRARTVLDLGCGTGAHAVRLARRGLSVVGVDMSAEMLRHARERAADAGHPDVELVHGDIRTIRLWRIFDAVVCMFAVLGYQTTDQDVADTLETVRTHLKPGGLFIFDVWYGPAVEATGPEQRVKVIPTSEGELERRASASLQPDAHLCAVTYQLTRRADGKPDQVSGEVHRMRYFFREELDAFLHQAGLSLVDLRPFPEMTGEPSPSTWNVLGTVRG